MKLINNYLSMHLKKALQYRSTFILTFISQIMSIAVELFTVMALFQKFSLLDIYNKYELLLGFSVIWFGSSFAEMFARGFDHFSKLIISGDFDLLLIRPRNLYLQIFGSEISYEKFSRVLISFLIFIYSSIKVINNFTVLKIVLLINMLVSSIIIYISLFIIGAAVCFVTIQGLEFLNIFTNGSRQVGQYPMGIYKKIVRIIFTFIIPLTLINYYPVKYLTDKTTDVLYIFIPMLTIILLLISILSFNKGVTKYCSTGS